MRRAFAAGLIALAGCAPPPPAVPSDPWLGREHDRVLVLRGMAPWPGGFPQLPVDEVEHETNPATPGASLAIPGAPDFAFVFRQGSDFLHRWNELTVDAAGRATLSFGGRRLGFRLSSSELERLQRALVLVDVFSLERAYVARADDGSQWRIHVQANGRSKDVLFSNCFPPAAVFLSEILRREILPIHAR